MPTTVEYCLPGGLRVIAGGTRVAINTRRPWQTSIVIDPAKCPFEDIEELKKRAQFAVVSVAGEEWRLFANASTPFASHRLLVPPTCSGTEDLYHLGGSAKITGVLEAVINLAKAESREVLLTVNIGPTAGQNQGHLHWHVLEPFGGGNEEQAAEFVQYARGLGPEFRIMDGDQLRVVCTGTRAGQCAILAFGGERLSVPVLGSLFHVLIKLMARKFQSQEGKPPDYTLGIRFDRTGAFCYALYTPILNHPGATEYLGMLDGSAMVIPWPHEVTAAYLLKE